jgi:hypothetical protein
MSASPAQGAVAVAVAVAVDERTVRAWDYTRLTDGEVGVLGRNDVAAGRRGHGGRSVSRGRKRALCKKPFPQQSTAFGCRTRPDLSISTSVDGGN